MSLLEIKNVHKISQIESKWECVRVLKSSKSYMFTYMVDFEIVIVKIRRKGNNGYYDVLVDEVKVWEIGMSELRDLKYFSKGISNAIEERCILQ